MFDNGAILRCTMTRTWLSNASHEHSFDHSGVRADCQLYARQVRQQLCDALHDASLPPAFANWVRPRP